MSDLEKRYIIKEQKNFIRQEKEVALCYRGTAYKKTVLNWSGDSVGGSIPPFSYWRWPSTEDTLRRLDGGNRPQKFWSIEKATYL